MRIACPYCGPREVGEFSYLGDAAPVRPPLDAGAEAFFDYVYLRDNLAGEMQENWYHGGGCRAPRRGRGVARAPAGIVRRPNEVGRPVRPRHDRRRAGTVRLVDRLRERRHRHPA